MRSFVQVRLERCSKIAGMAHARPITQRQGIDTAFHRVINCYGAFVRKGINMSTGSDDRTMWDLDVRQLDGYAEVEDASVGTLEAEPDVTTNWSALRENPTAPKKPTSPVTRPNPKDPNRYGLPATAYTPGVLNCVRGLPPRRGAPKKSR
jgi:hypothetical protein